MALIDTRANHRTGGPGVGLTRYLAPTASGRGSPLLLGGGDLQSRRRCECIAGRLRRTVAWRGVSWSRGLGRESDRSPRQRTARITVARRLPERRNPVDRTWIRERGRAIARFDSGGWNRLQRASRRLPVGRRRQRIRGPRSTAPGGRATVRRARRVLPAQSVNHLHLGVPGLQPGDPCGEEKRPRLPFTLDPVCGTRTSE